LPSGSRLRLATQTLWTIPKPPTINRNHASFKIADKVLVLDSELRKTPLGRPQENLARIRYSTWAKRLWTLQECAVASDVSFRFFKHNLSLKALLNLLETNTEYPLLQTQSLKDRNLVGFSEEDYDRLAVALSLLSDDMQIAESLRHIADPKRKAPVDYDSTRLRTILRLGLLTLPHMRYFPEAYESAQFQQITSVVLAEYDSVDADRDRRWRTLHDDPSALFARLETIQNVEMAEQVEIFQPETI
jgi:hypothetical protein